MKVFGATIEFIDTGTNVLTTFSDGEFENIEMILELDQMSVLLLFGSN